MRRVLAVPLHQKHTPLAFVAVPGARRRDARATTHRRDACATTTKGAIDHVVGLDAADGGHGAVRRLD